MKENIPPATADKLRLEESETVIELDGTKSGRTVLLHDGTSTWPGQGSFIIVFGSISSCQKHRMY